MNDFIAGPTSGPRDEGRGPWAGGTPPPALLAALGAAVLIAVTLVAFFVGGSSGGGDRSPVPTGVDDPGRGQAPVADGRVRLTLSVEGGGSGRVLIEPRGITCTESCEHQFVTGSRIMLSADAADGSRFEGFDDACSGSGRCTFTIDRERSVTATFEGSSANAPDNTPEPTTDCNDGRDNDGDGLIDSAQDPGCEADGTEADAGAPPPPPPPATTTPVPPPPPPPATTTPAPPATPGVSECHDGIDNDGDRKTDRPADPGCDADGTEAGG